MAHLLRLCLVISVVIMLITGCARKQPVLLTESQSTATMSAIPPANLASGLPLNKFLPLLNKGAAAQTAQLPQAFTPIPSLEDAKPHITIIADRLELRVGESLEIVGKVFGIGLPYYYLYVLDEGHVKPVTLYQVTYTNDATPIDQRSLVFECEKATGNIDQATFTLRALRKGSSEIWIYATGEVSSPTGPGWEGGGSETILVSVIE